MGLDGVSVGVQLLEFRRTLPSPASPSAADNDIMYSRMLHCFEENATSALGYLVKGHDFWLHSQCLVVCHTTVSLACVHPHACAILAVGSGSRSAVRTTSAL